MKTFLMGVAAGVGSAVGLVAMGVVVLVVGTPKGRKVLRSLAVSTVAASMNAADAVRTAARDAREDLVEIVHEAGARRKAQPHQGGMVETAEATS